MYKKLLFLLPLFLSFNLSADPVDIRVSYEIPQIQTSEYHRPYVALWIQDPTGNVVLNLTVLYDVEMKDNRGEEWLKDLRQWWRKSGRSVSLPLDAVSAPTRPVGVHEVEKTDVELPALTEGNYTLMVEAAREVGGREVVKFPFIWDGKEPVEIQAGGKSELGSISLTVKKST
ncbi:MAG: DUF2271 domain-containing protein [Verrucomicrobiales bacterium]|nr:DUF2271 domain-containing protein [Verrucomicrobiales bacterium]